MSSPLRWLDRFWTQHAFTLQMIGLLGVLLVGAFHSRVVITIRAGHEGVMFRPFFGGTQLHAVWAEGIHGLPPWDYLTIYDMRQQQTLLEQPTLSSTGVRVVLTVSVRYHPISETLPILHKSVGPDYFEKIVQPVVQAVLRKLIGHYTPEELYTTQGQILERALTEGLRKIEMHWVRLDDLLITKIELPEVVRTAIEMKAKQEQVALEYEWRIEREEKEAERKKIEATGIRDFQDIISTGITEEYLRWRGIEATLSLAESQNTKIIVIGNSESGGLPLILDTSTPTAPPSADSLGGRLRNEPDVPPTKPDEENEASASDNR